MLIANADTAKNISSLICSFRVAIIAMICLFIAACSGGSLVNQSSESVSDSHPLIDISPAVEKDFIAAIKLLKSNRNQEAITLLKDVIKREKRLPAPFINLAIAQNRLGDTSAAEQNLLAALKIDDSHPVANNELGLMYRKAGKFLEAKIAYRKALKNNDGYLPAIKNLGVLCDLYLHDFNCALEQYKRYKELKPDDKTIEIWIADVERRLEK